MNISKWRHYVSGVAERKWHLVVVSLPDEVYGHTGNADSAADFIFACLSAFADVPREDVRVARGPLVYPGTQGQLVGVRSPRPIWAARFGSS